MLNRCYQGVNWDGDQKGHIFAGVSEEATILRSYPHSPLLYLPAEDHSWQLLPAYARNRCSNTYGSSNQPRLSLQSSFTPSPASLCCSECLCSMRCQGALAECWELTYKLVYWGPRRHLGGTFPDPNPTPWGWEQCLWPLSRPTSLWPPLLFFLCLFAPMDRTAHNIPAGAWNSWWGKGHGVSSRRSKVWSLPSPQVDVKDYSENCWKAEHQPLNPARCSVMRVAVMRVFHITFHLRAFNGKCRGWKEPRTSSVCAMLWAAALPQYLDIGSCLLLNQFRAILQKVCISFSHHL